MTAQAICINGACHCGTVQFTATLADGFETIRRCNCSLCRMRGAVVVSAVADGIEISAGADNLTLYQFNTKVAKHYFCKTCGIYTHHNRRSSSGSIGVNVATLEGMSPFDFPELKVSDGINHPSDNGGVSRVAGVLRYEAS